MKNRTDNGLHEEQQKKAWDFDGATQKCGCTV